MMIAGLALAAIAAQGEATTRDDGPQIHVSGPDGTMDPILGLWGRPLGVVPFTTLADTVQRAGLIGDRFVIELVGAGPETSADEFSPAVTAVVHGRNELVVALEGGVPESGQDPPTTYGVFADLTVPRRIDGGENGGVEWVARRDFETIFGAKLEVVPPPTPFDSLLIFEGLLDSDPETALVIDLDGPGQDTPLALDMVQRVDAAFYATRSEPKLTMDLGGDRDEGAAIWRFRIPDELRQSLEESAVTLVIETGRQPSGRRRTHSLTDEGAAEIERPSLQGWTDIEPGALFESSPRGLEFMHYEGPREQLDIRPTMGPGAAWGDLDRDGLLDLVVLQGAGHEHTDPLPDRVWLGSESGIFRDVTHDSGLASGDAGMGALLVDLNGDGQLDLYCANYGLDRLFLGNGDGTFEDASELLPGLALWSASVVAGDPDGDGDLDLYVTSYLDYDESKMPAPTELGRYQREDPIEMLPFAFPGERNVFLRNTLDSGAFGFEDATEELGLLDASGRGMQAAFWDFDHDGDEDLYIANDVSPNVLFRNERGGRFKDVSFSTGLDDPRGGMGLALGDVDEDGDVDMFLTNWQLEANALYLNGHVRRGTGKRRRSSFHDATVESGLGPSGIGKTSWGAELFDAELDGDLDLFVANGYTSPDYESTGICVGQHDLFYVGDGKGAFRDASALASEALARPLASRGAIGADYDRDGDIDIVVTNNNGRLQLLTNVTEHEGQWLGLRLRQPGNNRYAIGASVAVETSDGRTRFATLRAGQGYLTGNPPELHFGLGDVSGVVSVRVTWPDGERSEHAPALGQWSILSRSR